MRCLHDPLSQPFKGTYPPAVTTASVISLPRDGATCPALIDAHQGIRGGACLRMAQYNDTAKNLKTAPEQIDSLSVHPAGTYSYAARVDVAGAKSVRELDAGLAWGGIGTWVRGRLGPWRRGCSAGRRWRRGGRRPRWRPGRRG